MKNRMMTLALVLAMCAGSAATPAGAEPAPREPLIVDPVGDANYLIVTDTELPVNRPEADIRAVWLTSKGSRLTLSWAVSADPTGKDVVFRLGANPDPSMASVDNRAAGSRCFHFSAVFPAADDPWDPYAGAGEACSGLGLNQPAVPLVHKQPDGSVVITTTYRLRKGFLESGDVLSVPRMTSFEFTVIPVMNQYVHYVRIDMTPTAPDYTVP